MVRRTNVRISKVFYQPNLREAEKPIPLGIIAERLDDTQRTVILIGWVPTRAGLGELPQFRLGDSWGPFQKVVTEWHTAISTSLSELMESVPKGDYALNELSKRWNSNLFLTAPHALARTSDVSLEKCAKAVFEDFTGKKVSFDESKPQPPTYALDFAKKRHPLAATENRAAV